MKEETLALRKEGIGVVLDSELPHLIGIDDDLLSTGIILYHLKVLTQTLLFRSSTIISTPSPSLLPLLFSPQLLVCPLSRTVLSQSFQSLQILSDKPSVHCQLLPLLCCLHVYFPHLFILSVLFLSGNASVKHLKTILMLRHLKKKSEMTGFNRANAAHPHV